MCNTHNIYVYLIYIQGGVHQNFTNFHISSAQRIIGPLSNGFTYLTPTLVELSPLVLEYFLKMLSMHFHYFGIISFTKKT